MNTAQFRNLVRGQFPHVTVKVKTVSFADLARAEAKCLSVEGERNGDELRQINQWAREAGIVPDGNLRCYRTNSAVAQGGPR